MRPAKIVAIVVGALLVLIGLGLLAPGGFLLGIYGTQRDDSGFFETSGRVVSTEGLRSRHSGRGPERRL